MGLKHRFGVKAGAFFFVFLLVSAGRWIASAGARLTPLSALFLPGSYGLIAAGMAAFAVDLVLVHSLLQRKLLCIRILASALLALATAEGFLVFSLLASAVTLSLSAAITASLFVFDTLRAGEPDFLVSSADTLPRRYLRRRPLKTAAETLLRLFPNPEPVGLYKVGSPGNDSPILVTGNFELTVRRVCSAVKNFDCWLLVCDSRGVNVWCASMAGHFTTDSVLQAVQRTNLTERAEGRLLILPQLCASSVLPRVLESRTDFHVRFGPLNISDLDTYRKNPVDPAVRAARFPVIARLEMALGSPLMLTIVMILLYNFIGPNHLPVLVPILYLASLVHGLLFPHRPVKRIGPWALLYGAVWFLVAGLLSRVLFPEHLLRYALSVGLGSAYLVTEFSGWSPLLKYSFIPRRKPRVEVDARTCVGCGRCQEVCPRGVFQMKGNHSVVIGDNRCVICRSCFSQCPTGAVRHEYTSR